MINKTAAATARYVFCECLCFSAQVVYYYEQQHLLSWPRAMMDSVFKGDVTVQDWEQSGHPRGGIGSRPNGGPQLKQGCFF